MTVPFRRQPQSSSVVRCVVVVILLTSCLVLVLRDHGTGSADPVELRGGVPSSAAPTNNNVSRATPMTTTMDAESSALEPGHTERIRHFRDTALSFRPVTDKVGGVGTTGHGYHNMYGILLLPYAQAKARMKFLEIGLGCNMVYGPGASVKLWKHLFPQAELWEADNNAACVSKATKQNQLTGIHTLVGDQENPRVLDQWIRQSGGKFDIIIDDGGHHNCQIHTTFDKLWPELVPGGIYFIEDMQVGKTPRYKHARCNNVIMSDRLLEWMDRLIYYATTTTTTENDSTLVKTPAAEYKYTMPEDILFVFCQAEACAIGKRHSEINDPKQLLAA